MKNNTRLNRSRRLKNNNQRRVMIKKLHQRVLVRRKQFINFNTDTDIQEAC